MYLSKWVSWPQALANPRDASEGCARKRGLSMAIKADVVVNTEDDEIDHTNVEIDDLREFIDMLRAEHGKVTSLVITISLPQ
jgi:hypothetical protein